MRPMSSGVRISGLHDVFLWGIFDLQVPVDLESRKEILFDGTQSRGHSGMLSSDLLHEEEG